MKAAYITSYDSTDVNQWSGLGSYIARSLEAQGIEWVRIGPLQRRLDPLIVGKFLVNKLLKKQYQRKRAPQVLHSYARQISERLKGLKVDFLFSPGTLELAYLKTELPMVFWTDCTFDGMVDFYPNMTHLALETLRDGHNAEQAALTGCRLALYCSQWAAQTALDHYDVDPSKVKVVPFGANFVSKLKADDIPALVAVRGREPVRLLFAGVEWERKGGDYAVALLNNLLRLGVPAELIVVGCDPPPAVLKPQIICRGFLSKNVPSELEELERLFSTSHYVVLPSRAECYGLVLTEANSFGVPILASDVGGFPEIVRQGRNGFCFPLTTFVKESTREIMDLRNASGAYEKLAAGAFAESQERLNWQAAGRQAKALIEAAIP